MSENNFDSREKIKELIKESGGIIKAQDIRSKGFDYKEVLEMCESGELVRVKSGYYSLSGEEHSDEELVFLMFKDGVLTMESALYYMGYLDKRPLTWSIAVNKNTSKSRFKIDYPVMQPYYTEGEALDFGVTSMEIAGHNVLIYEKDRLICEVLKYQEKMDREDFKKALLTYIQDDDKDVAKLMDYARRRKVLKKVQNIIGIWL